MKPSLRGEGVYLALNWNFVNRRIVKVNVKSKLVIIKNVVESKMFNTDKVTYMQGMIYLN